MLTQDDIRNYLGAQPGVEVQIAGPGDGSPEIAWGDTFFSLRKPDGALSKMPFATIVTKDYTGFDEASRLDRGGLFRLNLDVGKEKFAELFGFAPAEFGANQTAFDFAVLDRLMPHPIYAPQGWASIIAPSDDARELVHALLDFTLSRARGRA